ncbi:MAG TPA: sialate O-acetylesterase [Bryobacteraceae bacterium]|nr:sialate O-acetylesterase [Bryobacteraceae bacterium]
MRLRFSIPAALLGLAVGSFGQEIRITSGPADNQVLQRDLEQTARIALTGTASGKRVDGKEVEARVLDARATEVAGFHWTRIAKIQKQHWSGELKGIPTGGPYRLELRIPGVDSSLVSIANLLVGDLWVLAGQSNMEGHGDLLDVQPPVPLVRSFDMADHWRQAEEPLHTTASAVDPVHWPLNAQSQPERLSGQALETYIATRKKGAGLGLPFAAEMVARSGVPIGLIPCAHGGTSMDQWSPALKNREGESLYGSMFRRVQAAGGRVRGVLWYQGESDANPKAEPAFLERFEAFVGAVRADLNQPDLPFYYVQIGRHVDSSNVAEWNRVQLAQLRAEPEIPHSGMVASIDLQLDDTIHISTADLKRLGQRLADLVCIDLFSKLKNYGEMKRGPRPVQVALDGGVVKVSFSGVNGRLQADGRISGFSIHDSRGTLIPAIYKARVDPAEASTVLLYIQGKLPPDAMLWYGFGKDPYCNVRDAADMAVPVFAMKIASPAGAAARAAR